MSGYIKTIEYYLNLPWSFTIERKDDDGIYYFARVNELKCFSDGKTMQEASENILEALKLHLEASLEEGQDIPEPLNPEEFKGRITYRTKPAKHLMLAKEANRRGITLNRLIDETIDEAFTA